jgi:hypothetical protein
LGATSFHTDTLLYLPVLSKETGQIPRDSSTTANDPNPEPESQPVKLLVDEDLKQTLFRNREQIHQLIADDTLNPMLAGAAKRDIVDIADQLNGVSEKAAVEPVSRAFLTQIVADSSQLNSLAILPAGGVPDQLQLDSIRNDLAAKFSWFNNPVPQVRDPWVKVRAILGTTGKQMGRLTVCYRKQVVGPDKCESSFESPTSDTATTDHQLPVADYFLWAVDYLGKRVSGDKDLRLRNDVDDFTLLVTQ